VKVSPAGALEDVELGEVPSDVANAQGVIVSKIATMIRNAMKDDSLDKMELRTGCSSRGFKRALLGARVECTSEPINLFLRGTKDN
jgi:hypothetical protein